jgi:uncharacterized protein
MNLFSELDAGPQAITAVDDHQITIGTLIYTRSVLITPSGIDPEWGPACFAQLDASHLSPLTRLATQGIHLILLGTGLRQHFPPPALLCGLIEAQISVEVMDTAAACRTHNILTAEGRPIATALIIEPPISPCAGA